MFLSLDGTFWFQLINFAIFFALLNVVFLRPVGEAIRKRRAHIESVQGDYERYARQASTFRTDADAKRAAARREAEETIARARSAAEDKASAAVADKAAEAQKIGDAARATVAGEVSSAQARMPELASSLAKTLLERATGGKKVSDAFYEGVATWSQVAASVLFIVVMVVLWIRLVAPAVVASQARKNAELADSEARRDAAREEIDAAQREVTAAEEQARAILARAQSDASRISEKIANDANAEGARLLAIAGGELDRSRSVANDALRAELLEKAIAIARGSAATLDLATDKRLVDETVATADKSAVTADKAVGQ